MRKIHLVLMFILMFSFSACNPQTDSVNDPVVDPKDETPTTTDKEGEDVKDNSCKSSESVYLNTTDTINALELWNNSDVCENLVINENLIGLDDISNKGTLETNDFFIDSFKELVPSWNVLIDEHSKVSILIAIGNSAGYSEFYPVAMWRDDYKTSFSNVEDDYGYVNIDTVVPKLNDIDRIKFRVVFGKSETENTLLKNLSVTTVNNNDVINYETTNLVDKEITVTPRQQLSIPSIGNIICSPTSLSMVLNYYNHTGSQSIVAAQVYDAGNSMYGNWSFNASLAGGFSDLYSRVEYSKDVDMLMKYINDDIPLVLSIKTTNKADLEGSIMAYPSGHLVVLTGFKQIDNEWYVIINDPAEYQDDLVRREYKLSEFSEAYRGYMYVVQENDFE